MTGKWIHGFVAVASLMLVTVTAFGATACASPSEQSTVRTDEQPPNAVTPPLSARQVFSLRPMQPYSAVQPAGTGASGPAGSRETHTTTLGGWQYSIVYHYTRSGIGVEYKVQRMPIMNVAARTGGSEGNQGSARFNVVPPNSPRSPRGEPVLPPSNGTIPGPRPGPNAPFDDPTVPWNGTDSSCPLIGQFPGGPWDVQYTWTWVPPQPVTNDAGQVTGWTEGFWSLSMVNWSQRSMVGAADFCQS